MQVEKATPLNKRYSLSDGDGLRLVVNPSGSKLWQLRYRLNGKANIASLGRYPAVSLKQARLDAQSYRDEYIYFGKKPPSKLQARIGKQDERGGRPKFNILFEKAFVAWAGRQDWKAENFKRNVGRFDLWLKPVLGGVGVADLSEEAAADAVFNISDKGKYETARKLARWSSKVYADLIARKKLRNNPFEGLAANIPNSRTDHYPSLAPTDFPAFLNAFDRLEGLSATVRNAFELLLHIPTRSEELRGARWCEIDFEKKEWIIPPERMKGSEGKSKKLWIPLTSHAINILERQKKISGESEFVFASNSSAGYITSSAFHRVIERLGYKNKHCPHGTRSTFSSYLNEMQFHADAIELQLDHTITGSDVRRIYHQHAEYMEERIKLMTAWSTFLLDCRNNAV